MLNDEISKNVQNFQSHPSDWWQRSNRKSTLKKVFLEYSDESEVDNGNPVYVKEKD